MGAVSGVQNKAIRCFLGVHSFAPIPALQSEMGWTPSKFRKYINVIRYWNKLIKMSDDRLPKVIFKYSYNLGNNRWCNKIKSILQLANLDHLYTNKQICNLVTLENNLKSVIQSNWERQLDNKPKLRTFKLFKLTYCTSNYIHEISNRYCRSLIAKLRMGILQLHIETGRFNNTKLENRTCLMCNDNSIEDEIHFICLCSKYNSLRSDLFRKASSKNTDFINLPSKSKFIYLMKDCCREVAIFVKRAWEVRKKHLHRV